MTLLKLLALALTARSALAGVVVIKHNDVPAEAQAMGEDDFTIPTDLPHLSPPVACKGNTCCCESIRDGTVHCHAEAEVAQDLCWRGFYARNMYMPHMILDTDTTSESESKGPTPMLTTTKPAEEVSRPFGNGTSKPSEVNGPSPRGLEDKVMIPWTLVGGDLEARSGAPLTTTSSAKTTTTAVSGKNTTFWFPSSFDSTATRHTFPQARAEPTLKSPPAPIPKGQGPRPPPAAGNSRMDAVANPFHHHGGSRSVSASSATKKAEENVTEPSFFDYRVNYKNNAVLVLERSSDMKISDFPANWTVTELSDKLHPDAFTPNGAVGLLNWDIHCSSEGRSPEDVHEARINKCLLDQAAQGRQGRTPCEHHLDVEIKTYLWLNKDECIKSCMPCFQMYASQNRATAQCDARFSAATCHTQYWQSNESGTNGTNTKADPSKGIGGGHA